MNQVDILIKNIRIFLTGINNANISNDSKKNIIEVSNKIVDVLNSSKKLTENDGRIITELMIKAMSISQLELNKNINKLQ